MAAKKKTKATPEDVLAKVRKLLALAADPSASEEERRSSAMIAARLMREHGLDVGDTMGAAASSAPLPPLAPADVHRVVGNVRELAAAFSGPDGLVASMRSMFELFSPPPVRPKARKKPR